MWCFAQPGDPRPCSPHARGPQAAARAALTVAGLVLSSGCGGGSNPGPTTQPATPPAAPPASTSAGGIWFVPGTLETAATLFISEDGLLKIFDQGWLGTGAVIVTSGSEVAGSYERIKLQGVTTDPREFRQSCEISGTAQTRASLSLTILCEDWQGVTIGPRTLAFLYDPNYERESSLEAIAGNYAAPSEVLANTLSISSNGVVFGAFQNGGANCTVNGSIEIIDRDFTFYSIDLTLSLCTGIAAGVYDGKTMNGLVVAEPSGVAPGAFLMLTSLAVDAGLTMFSMIYEPT